MRKALLTALAAVSVLAACREQAADEQANSAVADAPSAAAANSASPAEPPLGAAVSGDQAKALMKERHDGMEDIGDAMKLVSRELKGESPDLAKVREGAGTIARLAPEVTRWFPPGTGPDVGKTEAKAEIWQKPEDFAAKRDAFQK
ncbi:MAG TPA: cytochrome c, partial [Sphingomicrobium sp.]|nr:cytochrome c [Sphingomicrobium sp.]